MSVMLTASHHTEMPYKAISISISISADLYYKLPIHCSLEGAIEALIILKKTICPNDEANPKTTRHDYMYQIKIMKLKRKLIILVTNPTKPYLPEACAASATRQEYHPAEASRCAYDRHRQSRRRSPSRPATTPSSAGNSRCPCDARGFYAFSCAAVSHRHRSCPLSPSPPSSQTQEADLGFCGAYSRPTQPPAKLQPEPPWPNVSHTTPFLARSVFSEYYQR